VPKVSTLKVSGRTIGFTRLSEPDVTGTFTCRVQMECDGTRWRTRWEVKGKLAYAVGSQYSSHNLGTWCIQHYYRWYAHLGCQQSTELKPPPADLNGLVRFAEWRILLSARVPSHFNWPVLLDAGRFAAKRMDIVSGMFGKNKPNVHCSYLLLPFAVTFHNILRVLKGCQKSRSCLVIFKNEWPEVLSMTLLSKINLRFQSLNHWLCSP